MIKRCTAVLTLALLALGGPAARAQEAPTRESLNEAARVNAQLALEYLKQRNLQAAQEKIDKALKQNGRTAETQMAAGIVYDQLGETRKARSHYEEAAKLGKDQPDVINNVAVFFCRHDERKRGEEYFLKAAASPLYRTPEVAYTNAGLCAKDDGRPKDAEKYFRKALTFKPDQPDALLQMAEIEHAAGNDLSARAFLQRHLAVAPATASSLWLGYRIEKKMGDSVHAQKYAERLKTEFQSAPEVTELLQEERSKP